MPDKPPGLPPVPEASAPAPFIYFDIVPTFGFNNGVASLTLDAVRFTADDAGKVSGGRVTVAHLRTSFDGLRQLKAAIEGIERALQKPAPDLQARILSTPPLAGKGH